LNLQTSANDSQERLATLSSTVTALSVSSSEITTALASHAARLDELFRIMQALEADANEALDGLTREIDAASGSLEILQHSKAANENLNELREWVNATLASVNEAVQLEILARKHDMRELEHALADKCDAVSTRLFTALFLWSGVTGFTVPPD
jgi:copper homeostasis protein CutC